MTTRTRNQTHHAQYDWGLLSIVAILLSVGMVMVFSASYVRGLDGYEDPYYFAVRQILWCGVGVAALIIAARIPYRWWQTWSVPLMGVALLSLLAVLVFGTYRLGSYRTLVGGSIQPSEPVKVVVILYVGAWLASKGKRIRDVRVGLLPFSVLMGAISVLIVAQPKITTAILIVATAGIMFFIAGAELKQLLLILVVGTLTFGLVLNYSSYANERLELYWESVWDPIASSEYQVQRSVEALARGGPTGVGVGQGLAQMPGYLPLSWSDNIYAVIGEETGLLGSLFVILLFVLLAYRGLRIALSARDHFGMLVAVGITTSLILQAILNIAVAVAAAPPTGITLPFVSYGGSSLVTALGAIGILLNIGYHNTLPAAASGVASNEESPAYARFDFGWGNRRARLPGTGRRRPAATKSRRSRATGVTRTAQSRARG